jgi:hypothetical protein
MKYYISKTEYNAGVDLHSKNMYVCIMDRAGGILVHENIRNNDLDHLKRLIGPYRHDLTLAFESCFMGAWFADFCEDEGLPHVMAHAFYLRSIQCRKHKNDKRDSQEIADCLRMAFVQNSSRLLGFSMIDLMAHGLPTPKIHSRSRKKWCAAVREAFDEPFQQAIAEANVATVEHYNRRIEIMEQILARHANSEDSLDFKLLCARFVSGASASSNARGRSSSRGPRARMIVWPDQESGDRAINARRKERRKRNRIRFYQMESGFLSGFICR